VSTASLLAEYMGYSYADNRRFAFNRSITMQDKGESYNITLEFTKAAFDEPVDMSFSIPSRYERK
jgi:hypothetical protein